jgi:hypothetical protein
MVASIDVDKGLAWMVAQQEIVLKNRIFGMDTIYINTEQKNIQTRGLVADVASLTGLRLPAPYVLLDSSGDVYSGTAGGVAGAVAVELYKAADILYRFGTRFPVSGGSWTSDIPITAGITFALLVADAAPSPTRATYAMSGTPGAGDKYLVDYEIGVYARSDIDYRTDNARLQMVTLSDADGQIRIKVPPTYLLDSGQYIGYGFLALGATMIVRLLEKQYGSIVNSSEYTGSVGYQGILQSFYIPKDDLAGRSEGELGKRGYELFVRSWVYDDSLAVFAFTASHDYVRAKKVLTALDLYDQRDKDKVTGAPSVALSFSYDTFLGLILERYLRTGAIAWVGMSINYYERKTGDTSFRRLAIKQATYLLSLQVDDSDPNMGGSILGGSGHYDDGYVARTEIDPETMSYHYDPAHPKPLPKETTSFPSLGHYKLGMDYTWQLIPYQFFDTPVDWCSTEHNIDSYFFLRDLGKATGDTTWSDAAKRIKKSLLTHHWNAAEQRFNQGVHVGGPDTAHALDMGSWGGLFLVAIGEHEKALASAAYCEYFKVTNESIPLSNNPDSYNETYSHGPDLIGYKPYRSGDDSLGENGAPSNPYSKAPTLVWGEGTYGVILLRKRLGLDTADLEASMLRMQSADPRGGVLYVTRGDAPLPWEFHAWPAMASTGWGVTINTDQNAIFAADSNNELLVKMPDGTWQQVGTADLPLHVKQADGTWSTLTSVGSASFLSKGAEWEPQ